MPSEQLVRVHRQRMQAVHDMAGKTAPFQEGAVFPVTLAGALYQVLEEQRDPEHETAETLNRAWSRAVEVARVVPREVFDDEAFFLAAFATALGIEEGLEDPEICEAVLTQFNKRLTSLVAWARRRGPGRARVRYYDGYYSGAVDDDAGEPEAERFLGVAWAFADKVGERIADAEAFAAVREEVALLGLQVFFDALVGTVKAVRTWEVVVA